MKKKIKLDELKVKSFVTTTENENFQGGVKSQVCLATNICDPSGLCIQTPHSLPCLTPAVMSMNYDCPVITRVNNHCHREYISRFVCTL